MAFATTTPAGPASRLWTRTSRTGGKVELRFGNGITLEGSAWATVDVHVPDEPVDGYNLWRPRIGAWPSNCTCVSRRYPTLPGNWDIIARDDRCRAHTMPEDDPDW